MIFYGISLQHYNYRFIDAKCVMDTKRLPTLLGNQRVCLSAMAGLIVPPM